MSFNHERQDGSSSSEHVESSTGLGLAGKAVGGGLLLVVAACALYTLAGAAIAIGTLAFKGIIALSIAIAVIASILSVASLLKESFFGDDEAFA